MKTVYKVTQTDKTTGYATTGIYTSKAQALAKAQRLAGWPGNENLPDADPTTCAMYTVTIEKTYIN